MKSLLQDRGVKSKSSIAISIAVHAVLFAGLTAITFRYPVEELFRREPVRQPALRWVKLAPKPAGPTVAPSARRATRPSRSQAMPAPLSIPIGIPEPARATSPSAVVTGAARDTSRAVGVATGIQPGIPSSRLITDPMAVGRVPLTDAQKAERALTAIYEEYVDSVRVARADPRRKPGDWSFGGKDGDRWGWDASGIHIGGITIPNVVLAALPLNVPLTGRNMNAVTDGRADAYMRADIKFHGDMMSEDEFRAAVKRIRERVDRERQEKMAKAKPKPPPCCS